VHGWITTLTDCRRLVLLNASPPPSTGTHTRARTRDVTHRERENFGAIRSTGFSLETLLSPCFLPVKRSVARIIRRVSNRRPARATLRRVEFSEPTPARERSRSIERPWYGCVCVGNSSSVGTTRGFGQFWLLVFFLQCEGLGLAVPP